MSDTRFASERVSPSDLLGSLSLFPSELSLLPSETAGKPSPPASSTSPGTVLSARRATTASSRVAPSPPSQPATPPEGSSWVASNLAVACVAFLAGSALATLVIFGLTGRVVKSADGGSLSDATTAETTDPGTRRLSAGITEARALSAPPGTQEVPPSAAPARVAPAVPALAPPLFARQTSAPVQPASGAVDTKAARATIAAPMPSLAPRRPVDSRLAEKPPALPDAPFVGAITLESEPAGAQVFVDGRPIGLTPLLNWEVRAGSHVVRVESQGYSRWSSAVRVVTGNTLSVVATLQPARDH